MGAVQMKAKNIVMSLLLTASTLLFSACAGGEDNNSQVLSGAPNIFSLPEASAASQAPVSQQTPESQQAPVSQQTPENPISTPVSETTSQPGTLPTPTVQANIRDAEWSTVEWEQYATEAFTLIIPKGWKVEYSADLNQVSLSVKHPTNAITGISMIDRGNVYKTLEGAQMMGRTFYIESGTVQEFFEKSFADTTQYFTVQSSAVPADYQVLQQARPNSTINDYRTLYATFSENGREGEGMYSALIFAGQDVYMNGGNYGMWEVDFVHYCFAPQGELKNWLPVFVQMMKSFNYTQEYIYAWQQANSTTSTPDSGSGSTDDVLQAFEERSEQDTIIQEKRSDMIGEYERVYDNDSGKIYRAYNGFLEDIGGSNQSRFTPITDHQYTEGFSGWIDK